MRADRILENSNDRYDKQAFEKDKRELIELVYKSLRFSQKMEKKYPKSGWLMTNFLDKAFKNIQRVNFKD